MKDDVAYLRHISEYIRRIEEDVAEGRDRLWNLICFKMLC